MFLRYKQSWSIYSCDVVVAPKVMSICLWVKERNKHLQHTLIFSYVNANRHSCSSI